MYICVCQEKWLLQIIVSYDLGHCEVLKSSVCRPWKASGTTESKYWLWLQSQGSWQYKAQAEGWRPWWGRCWNIITRFISQNKETWFLLHSGSKEIYTCLSQLGIPLPAYWRNKAASGNWDWSLSLNTNVQTVLYNDKHHLKCPLSTAAGLSNWYEVNILTLPPYWEWTGDTRKWITR